MFELPSQDEIFADLDEDTRRELAVLFDLKNVLLGHQMTLNDMRVRALLSPNTQLETSISDYESVMIAPLRTRIHESEMELMKRAVDLEHMKGMLPMILMMATQGVNIPLALTIVGIDPNSIATTIGKIREMITEGMG